MKPPTCPTTNNKTDCVTLAHGEGGRLMRQMLQDHVERCLHGKLCTEDSARLNLASTELAVTTDSFVVSPLFFPGGDIGSLAVFGTVNDLAVSGAKPLALTLALMIEEGLPLSTLDRILQSVRSAAETCQVTICAGDTKVVPRGVLDQIFLNTTGFGSYLNTARLGASKIQVGDKLIVSGPIAHHGVAVLAARENLQLEPALRSDSAPLHEACERLHTELGDDLRAMRDATRGGVSAVLHEWSIATGLTMQLQEKQIPISDDVRGACELLGLDPLYVANEGTFVAAVSSQAADRAIHILDQLEVTARAQEIGHVVERLAAPVVIERLLGTLAPLDEPAGAPLPRIC